jgi:hypothetical protein
MLAVYQSIRVIHLTSVVTDCFLIGNLVDIDLYMHYASGLLQCSFDRIMGESAHIYFNGILTLTSFFNSFKA